MITKYTVQLRSSDNLTYLEVPALCDGSLSATILALSCTIANTALNTSPLNLLWGSSIYAKVIATNLKGNSPVSDSGNGAVILRAPDAPVGLANVPSITNAV